MVERGDFDNVAQAGESRASYWVFTINNWTEAEQQHLRDISLDERVAFISWGREVAPTTGTRHLQGHLELTSRLRFRQVRTLLGERVWLAVRRGTFEQAEEYVEKDGEFESFGERRSSGRGSRSDLEALKADLDARLPLRDVADMNFGAFLRYQRGIQAYRLLHAVPRNWRTEVIVYWGVTHSGKTHHIYANAKNMEDVWRKTPGKWFDSYDQQEITLFDEFKPSQYDITFMLELLDRWPLQVEIKGGFVNWAPREIYITSNMDPSLWYANALPEHRAALMRRIGHVVHFAERYNGPVSYSGIE